MERFLLGSRGSRQIPASDFREYDNETSGSIKDREFLL